MGFHAKFVFFPGVLADFERILNIYDALSFNFLGHYNRHFDDHRNLPLTHGVTVGLLVISMTLDGYLELQPDSQNLYISV